MDRLVHVYRKHSWAKMIYSISVTLSGAFLFGLLLGGVIVGLWQRARLARLEAAWRGPEQTTLPTNSSSGSRQLATYKRIAVLNPFDSR